MGQLSSPQDRNHCFATLAWEAYRRVTASKRGWFRFLSGQMRARIHPRAADSTTIQKIIRPTGACASQGILRLHAAAWREDHPITWPSSFAEQNSHQMVLLVLAGSWARCGARREFSGSPAQSCPALLYRGWCLSEPSFFYAGPGIPTPDSTDVSEVSMVKV